MTVISVSLAAIRSLMRTNDGGPDVFVHVHDVEAAGMRILVAGQSVAYEVGLARDGRSKAVKLRLLNP
jgi:cold shock CspA family protein